MVGMGKPSDTVLKRQAAASFLRAARLTDDPVERESLRRQAAELLAPRKDGRAAETKLDDDEAGPKLRR